MPLYRSTARLKLRRPASSVSTVFPVTSGQNLLLRAQDVALADTTAIATWSDTAGVGPYDLTQATAGSRPQIALSGGNDALPYVYFETLVGRSIANTSYPVDKRASSFFVVLDITSAYTSKYVVTLGGGIVLVYMHDTGILKRYDGGTTSTSLTQIPTGRRVAILVTLGAAANKVYVDSSTNVQSLSAEAAGSITGFQFGGAGGLRAKIYEARGWNRELSSGEVSQILDTWSPAIYGTGSAATTPTGRVIFDGDSVTEGLGGTKALNWPYFAKPANGWVGHNYAVQGQTWTNLIARQATTNTFANSTNWLIVHCGANDVGGGRTGAQMETDFQTYMTAAVTAGFTKAKLVATTLNTQSTGGTARNDFNTWLRANYSTYAGFLVDLAADANLGINDTTSVKNNATYWADGVHYTDAGYQLYAALVRSTISPPW